MDNAPRDDYASILRSAFEAQARGDQELAHQFFSRASELNPQDPAGWEGRAATTLATDEALLSLGFAVALEPSNGPRKLDFQQRLQARAIASNPGDAPALIIIGEKLAQVGLIEQGRRLLRRAKELDAAYEEGLVWLAGTTDDTSEAERLLRQALTLNPKNVYAQAGLAALTLQPAFIPSVSAGPPSLVTPGEDPAAPLLTEADQALREGNMPLALQIFTHAIEISPRSENAWLGRARTTNDIDEALTCLEQVIAINPNNVQAREARTFYRVRKLREGMRKVSEPVEQPRFNSAVSTPDEPSSVSVQERHRLRVVLLVLLIILLIALAAVQISHFQL